jgi:aryl-phospho-beta-D-glucosidase BglC (GH1 family)
MRQQTDLFFKVRISQLCLVFACGFFCCAGQAAQANHEAVTQQFTIKTMPELDRQLLAKTQSFISVKGNKLVNEQGKVVTLRGMNVADPDKLVKDGQWSKALFVELKEWGVNVIRLPVHPLAWRERGQAEYIKLLDQAVLWANALELYLIIDWHSIGYLPSAMFQHPMYETSMEETKAFWQLIAKRYKGVSTIAVYELFNEPTDLGGKAGIADWNVWKAVNEELIDIIYAHDTKVIPLVAGFNWAYDLRPVKQAPIDRPGIAYTSHPYPQKAKSEDKSKENFFALWEEYWGFVGDKYPLILTELGWVNEGGFGAHIPVMDDGSYGPRIVEYMSSKGLSWVGWCFDPQWSPTMIQDWDYTPTQQGVYFKKVLQEKQL